MEREIKQEKESGKELDSKIQEWEKKLRNKRREIGGTNAGSNFQANAKKQEKVLENRLDHVFCNFIIRCLFLSIIINTLIDSNLIESR